MCHGARLPGQAIPTAVQMRNYIIVILLFDHQCSWLAAPQWAVIWYNNQPKVGAPCVLQTHTPKSSSLANSFSQIIVLHNGPAVAQTPIWAENCKSSSIDDCKYSSSIDSVAQFPAFSRRSFDAPALHSAELPPRRIDCVP